MTRQSPEQITADHIERIERRFNLLYSNPVELRELLRKGLTFNRKDNIEAKLKLFFELALLSEEIIEGLVSGGESYFQMGSHIVWEALVRNRICVKVMGEVPGIFADHSLDGAKLRKHLRHDTFRNLFYPPSALPNRYAQSLVAVDVEKGGDCQRGSGLVVRRELDNAPFVITCRHNIDSADGIVIKEIKTAGGIILPLVEPIVSNDFDIAIFPIQENLTNPVFRLDDAGEVFDEVYTLGYPNIPGGDAALLGHRGEINGRVHLYAQNHSALLISNLVSPGSSGCPVLARDGIASE